jgi:hypothetical protein
MRTHLSSGANVKSKNTIHQLGVKIREQEENGTSSNEKGKVKLQNG